MRQVYSERRELALTPIPAKFSKVGGYKGAIVGKETVSYEAVLVWCWMRPGCGSTQMPWT